MNVQSSIPSTTLSLPKYTQLRIPYCPPRSYKPNVLRGIKLNALETQISKNNTESASKESPFLTEGDVAKMISDKKFPLSSDQLITKAKEYLLYQFETGTFNPDFMAPDFEFVAPVVGPLKKEEFVPAFNAIKITEFMSDLMPNYHYFQIDPFQPNRVWFFVTGRGTNDGPLPGGKEASGKKYIGPPECSSLTFNEQGLVTKFTIGYVLDRTVGNTGGLGGAYGLLYSIGAGLPFPEAQPFSPSLQYRLFQFVGRFASSFAKNDK